MKIDSNTDELIIKLLHFFIIEMGYNPVILHGAKDEIWLEKINSEYTIIRICSNYIHNNDQLEFDFYKTDKILSDIKKKTFLFKTKVLNIFVNLSDYVNLEDIFPNQKSLKVSSLDELAKNKIMLEHFPKIVEKTNFEEKGMELFIKITEDIGRKNEMENKKAEEVFNLKKPVVTYAIIGINILLFVLMYIFGNGSEDAYTLVDFGAMYPAYVRQGEYFRLIVSGFLHIGIIHLVVNNYALYVIGPQIESFFGKTKYIIIYLFSILMGNLLSMLFNNAVGAGASGAIFGLLGALLYFGYHYRVYFGTVIKSQILPLIFINLFIGFSLPGIDNLAHIGGLIGGFLITMAIGVKYKSSKSEMLNGVVLTTMFTIFLIYLGFFN